MGEGGGNGFVERAGEGAGLCIDSGEEKKKLGGVVGKQRSGTKLGG